MVIITNEFAASFDYFPRNHVTQALDPVSDSRLCLKNRDVVTRMEQFVGCHKSCEAGSNDNDG
jgi:hypothetical protein